MRTFYVLRFEKFYLRTAPEEEPTETGADAAGALGADLVIDPLEAAEPDPELPMLEFPLHGPLEPDPGCDGGLPR